ncbi:MAG: response regulator transcription factor [Candidatus Competibacteraceae bacterium]|nr:response regulator transcription factor [Candidatus Competibacteraceae bacterium]
MRILLVDDHTLFREALLHVLKQFESSAVVIEAATAKEAIRLAAHYHDLDLILLDLALPGSSGLSALPELRELRPTVPLVILSASEEPLSVRQALRMGAMGYIPKSCSSHEMISALRLVMAGEIYVPPALLSALEALEMPPAASGTDSPGETPARPPPAHNDAGFEGLTPRQLEVLRLMAQGLSNKTIGKRLNVAEGTIKLHVTAVMRALHAANRTQAVIEAGRRGLIAGAKPPADDGGGPSLP